MKKHICASAVVTAIIFMGGTVASANAAEVSTYEFSGPGGLFSVTAEGNSPDSARVSSSGELSTEVQFSTLVDSPDDAALYDLVLPEGASAQVLENESGESSVLLLNEEGKFLGGIAAAQVVDASGVEVPTIFSVDGSTVTQSLAAENTGSVEYPVTVAALAGPDWYVAAWVTTESRGYIVNADPTALGRIQNGPQFHAAHVVVLKDMLGSQAYRVNYNIEQQFVCHVAGAWFPTGVFNMESWQPSHPWTDIAVPWIRCNVT